ncbi:hypothetical protein K457DRAFT_902139 [Linnemannia elongata AG-77]|uniref:Concanavalin A-like lectin/glucanase n=1 Tax=Linnemannia elongata AG-77 TaxID=1314771 RepID=A0A197KCT3_9FUNG|nr:hypothetical protein K457DRAFT_902139 [Linnemannia elongata AG-77]
MKITAAVAILASCVPSLGFALVGNDWSFAKAPVDGLKDITFPFNMAKAPHKSGFYFAQQFNFHGIEDVGYTGLQPREDQNGKSIVHAAFSSFQAGTTTKHPNCHTGADGGPGVSCAVDIVSSYLHTYKITVENIGDTTWRGTLIDTLTRKATVIGEWTLPQGAGKIVNGQMGFVEYYTWNGQPSHTCDSLPYTQAFFYHPTSKTAGAKDGKVTKVYEYGDCVGKAGYVVKERSTGYDIKVGF